MPKTLEKTRKKIAKKRGAINALHEFSRDSKRLHRAQVRDERLEHLAARRQKRDQPFVERVGHFQEAMRERGMSPVTLEGVRELIAGFVREYDDELGEVKKTRRPGRPASAREDLLKAKLADLTKEYKIGFLLPDLTEADNVAKLDRWGGEWSYLSNLRWVRVPESGDVRQSSFPPKS